MAADREQYTPRGTKASWRKWKRRLKRSLVRIMRRDGKHLREDAPRRVTAGWTD